MQDDEIVKLYQQRNEAAIKETSLRYGSYLKKIAINIVSDAEDANEVINDVYLAVWNSIPPQKPAVLSLYLAKLTRRIAIDRVRRRTRVKRKTSQFALSLEELDVCISAGNTTEQDVDVHLLSEAINSYLAGLPQVKRDAFIGRYFYADSIQEIAAYCGLTVSATKTMLFRIRAGLKEHLTQEGFINE